MVLFGLVRMCDVCVAFPFAASIKDIYHERAWLETSISQVRVRVVVEVSSREQGSQLLIALREAGYSVDSLSSNYQKDVSMN